jgi:hypothetical protein
VRLKRVLAVLFVGLVLPYALAPVYRFPPPRSFSGSELWNPYARVRGHWLRANFHAHGLSWGGVTNGAQSDAEVVAAYRAAGYDVAGISDYQHIADPAIAPLPEYEHGYNAGKHHQLVLGARYVVWLDFPFWQGINQKQYVLDRLRPSADLISINHPSRLHSYTVEDVRQLTGYALMEVANGRVTTEDRWDAALSTGHPVLALGGDDTHDVTDTMRMAVAWNLVDAASASPADVIDALRAGRSYVVIRTIERKVADNLTVEQVTVTGNTINIVLDGPPATITFIGQDGATRKTVTGTTSASYAFAPADTYIRTNVHGDQTDLYLNPIIRSSGGQPRWPGAGIDPFWTLITRLGVIAACGAVVRLAWRT